MRRNRHHNWKRKWNTKKRRCTVRLRVDLLKAIGEIWVNNKLRERIHLKQVEGEKWPPALMVKQSCNKDHYAIDWCKM